MPKRLILRTNGPTAVRSFVTNSETYDMLFDWNIRTADWRVSITRRSDGGAVCGHRRLSPGLSLLALSGEGALFVEGSSPYPLEALDNGTLRIVWRTAEELTAGRASTATADTLMTLV